MNTKEEALLKRGQDAFESKNYGYVLILLQQLLLTAPEHIQARKMLRAAAIANAGKKVHSAKPESAIKAMQLQPMIAENPADVMQRAEAILAEDPYHLKTNQILFEAALKMGLDETAIFAAETLFQGHKHDSKVGHWAGDEMINLKQYETAYTIFNHLIQIDGSDFEAIKKSKDALTLKSIAERDETSLQANLREPNEAAKLAVLERLTGTTEQRHTQVEHLIAEYDQSPSSDKAVRISQRLEDMDQIESSLLWLEQAKQLNASDSSLRVPLSRLREKKGKIEIGLLRQFLSENPDHPNKASIEVQIAELETGVNHQRLQDSQNLVTQNPTDREARLKLGQHLFEAARFEEALPHLQKARDTPALQHEAMLLLGKCFGELEMHDLAAEELEEAIEAIPGFPELKKELLYQAAAIYRQCGRDSDALKALKTIYKYDCDFRDVAILVKSSYGQSQLVS